MSRKRPFSNNFLPICKPGNWKIFSCCHRRLLYNKYQIIIPNFHNESSHLASPHRIILSNYLFPFQLMIVCWTIFLLCNNSHTYGKCNNKSLECDNDSQECNKKLPVRLYHTINILTYLILFSSLFSRVRSTKNKSHLNWAFWCWLRT